MDVSDIVQYNVHLLNPHDLSNSFFCLSKNDPTEGFAYDASKVAGCVYPTSGKPFPIRHWRMARESMRGDLDLPKIQTPQ